MVIVRLDVQRGRTPDLAQAGNVPEHERASGERRFENRQAERLIAGRKRVDRSLRELGRNAGAVELTEVFDVPRFAYSAAGLRRGSGNTHRPRNPGRHGFERRDVLAGVPQPTRRKNSCLLRAGTILLRRARIGNDVTLGAPVVVPD